MKVNPLPLISDVWRTPFLMAPAEPIPIIQYASLLAVGRSSLTFLRGAPSQRLPRLARVSRWSRTRHHLPYRGPTTTPQSSSSNLCVTRSKRESWSHGGSASHKSENGTRESRRMFGAMSALYVHPSSSVHRPFYSTAFILFFFL